jgi:hypothetical protein
MIAKALISFSLLFATTLASFSFARGLRPPAFDDNSMHHLFNSTDRGALKLEQLASTPSGLFNTILLVLILSNITFKIFERSTTQAGGFDQEHDDDKKEASIRQVFADSFLTCVLDIAWCGLVARSLLL